MTTKQSRAFTETAEGEIVITRTFDAPRERLWQAWTDPAMVQRWWGPATFTAPECSLELRVGGKYLFCMRSPEGQDFWSTGVYREIAASERLVFTDAFADADGNPVPASHYGMAGDWPEELLVTLTFRGRAARRRSCFATPGCRRASIARCAQPAGMSRSTSSPRRSHCPDEAPGYHRGVKNPRGASNMKMETRQELLRSIGLLILRVGFGGYMATHGFGKLQMLLDRDFEMWGDPIGIGGPPSLVLAVMAEFLCALLVVFGVATRFAAVPVVITMAVAALHIHGADPWTMEVAAKRFFAGETEFPASKEMAMLYLFPFLALIFTGAGRFSIDALLLPRLCARRGARSSIES